MIRFPNGAECDQANLLAPTAVRGKVGRRQLPGEFLMRLARTGFVGLGIGVLAIAGASPAGAASGTQHFTVVNTSTANNPPASWLSASGPIHRLGIDYPLTSNKDRFAFHNGSLIIVHKPKHDSQSQDPGSCLFTFTETGTYTVASGTGAYVHAKGSGTYTVTAFGIGCSEKAAPLVASQIIQASGPLSY